MANGVEIRPRPVDDALDQSSGAGKSYSDSSFTPYGTTIVKLGDFSDAAEFVTDAKHDALADDSGYGDYENKLDGSKSDSNGSSPAAELDIKEREEQQSSSSVAGKLATARMATPTVDPSVHHSFQVKVPKVGSHPGPTSPAEPSMGDPLDAADSLPSPPQTVLPVDDIKKEQDLFNIPIERSSKRQRKPSTKYDDYEKPMIKITPKKTVRKAEMAFVPSMPKEQFKYALAIIRTLKRHRDIKPFLEPVDADKLGIPNYRQVIEQPMDISTVDRKLNNNQYPSVDNFIQDVRLIFSNCYAYNGLESPISGLCQNVEKAFESSLRQMPVVDGSHSPSYAKPPTPNVELPPSPPLQKSHSRSGTRTPTPPPITSFSDARPKREIHPPKSKDYPETYTHNPSKLSPDLKFCCNLLRELKKPKYRDINFPFLQPVDIVALNIPHYPQIVKEPMDLGTMEEKLFVGAYKTGDDFEADMRLVFNNCYLFNPASTPVHVMGKKLEELFNTKWTQRPPPSKRKAVRRNTGEQHMVAYNNSDDEMLSEADDDHISVMQRQLMAIQNQLASLRHQKSLAQRKNSKADRSKSRKSSNSLKRKRPSDSSDRYPEFTFEEKQNLSQMINTLNDEQLSNVVSIIRTSLPNLDGSGAEEIELDIDSLDRKTLHKLNDYVLGCKDPSRVRSHKKNRHGYTEEESDRKIQELEKVLQRFESANGGKDLAAATKANYSSSSDDSSSSGSDSDSDSDSD
ncbi:hypothetical protein BZG36_03297 [Bifiguratus adelaidae]|uniref:Bromodomain-containing protein n=1 Tax=Bifiguratus adelaidae TaxID=1938954 RepID=A0A261XZN3_9FUNG|nr:hypothetical protein BZG36_03297 [Bifiguratus adelaidae]